MASKSVLINLGSGSLRDGFPRVTAQLWGIEVMGEAMERSLPEQYMGSLPPAPHLIHLYRNWQTVYRGLCSRFLLLAPPVDDTLEIEAGGITNVSQFSFDELCQQFQNGINEWLRADSFLNIDRQVRSQLDPSEEVRVIIATHDEQLRRLPWQQWEFFRDYPRAEIALARPEYKRREAELRRSRHRVRVLAILGDTQDIDIEAESRFLHSLADADVDLLVNPARPEFTMKLWDATGWDILFFAGHSHSEGETGRIYLNEAETENSLTIDQLEEALKTAVENGLQLAIFNSCDGLGLAIALEKLHTPVAIVMREPVPNRVAQDFFKHFLQAFALDRQSLYLSVQQARRKLQGLESEYPGASWLPAICQNPAVEPPTWLRLGGVPPCPYRALTALTPEDGALFWGRSGAVRDLVTAVQKKPLVAVVGASGSGKTSLVNAGLVPKLTHSRVLWFCPHENPLGALAAVLVPYCGVKGATATKLERMLRQNPEALGTVVERVVQHAGPLVLIAESFESLYHRCPEATQHLFLDRLLYAARSAPNFTVVLVLRSDAYHQAVTYAPLRDALRDSVQWLMPLDQEALQAAIEQPAAQMGVQLEKGLSEKLIQDLGDPARLAVLQMVLTQLWTTQHQGWLTHQAYDEMGGMEKILTRHAEMVYAQLNEGDRRCAQRLLTQLVRWNLHSLTARTATQTEVKPENWDLVTHLATARLVTTQSTHDEPTIAIIHDRLIQSWGRLEHWMQVNGEFRRWQEQLRATIESWQDQGQQEADLLEGKFLVDAEAWKKQRLSDLSALEQDFIERSRRHHKQQVKQERRRIIGLKLLLGMMSLACLGAIGLGGWALWQSRQAMEGQAGAIATSSRSLFALDQRLDALIQAMGARSLLEPTWLADRQIARQVENALLQAVYGTDEVDRLPGATAVATREDGQQTAIATGYDIQLWQVEDKRKPPLSGHQGTIWSLAFHDQRLVSASEDGTARIWRTDQVGIAPVVLAGHRAAVRQATFSPDGTMVATASIDGSVKLWKTDGTLLQTLQTGGAVTDVGFSPTGQTLAASANSNLHLWHIAEGKARFSQTLAAPGATSLSFGKNGQILAANAGNRVQVWTRDRTGAFAAKPSPKWLGSAVSKVRFSADGRTLAVVEEQQVTVLDAHYRPLRRIKQSAIDVAFSTKPDLLLLSNADQTRFWQLKNAALNTINTASPITQVAFSPNTKQIATATADSIQVWKLDGTLSQTIPGTTPVTAIALSPDGTLAQVTNGEVSLWRLNPKPERLITFGAGVRRVLFSPDGQMMTLGAETQWWSREGKLLKTLPSAQAMSISADGQVWILGGNGTVYLWRTDGTRLQTLKAPGGKVTAVAISPEGDRIFAAVGQVLHLGTRTGTWLQQVDTGSDIRSIAFSPKGEQVAAVTAHSLIFWDWTDDKIVALEQPATMLDPIAFSQTGEPQVFTASQDGVIKLWQTQLMLSSDRLKAQACESVKHYLSNAYHSDPPTALDQARELCS
jgi:WD40 repeat protein